MNIKKSKLFSALFAFALAFLMMIGGAMAATPGNQQSPGIGEIKGQGKPVYEAHRTFRLVRYVPASGNNDSATLGKYAIVIWDILSDDGITVTTTTTSGDTTVAGITPVDTLTPDINTLGNTATADEGNRNWTWIQTYGKALVNWESGGGAATAGGAFGTAATAGRANTFTFATTAGSNVNGIAGFVYNTVSGASDGEDTSVFLRLE